MFKLPERPCIVAVVLAIGLFSGFVNVQNAFC